MIHNKTNTDFAKEYGIEKGEQKNLSEGMHQMFLPLKNTSGLKKAKLPLVYTDIIS